MRPGLAVLAILFLTGCGTDEEAPTAPSTGAPVAAPAPQTDPLLREVCAAYELEIAADPNPETILVRSAVRAVDNGVSESDLNAMGGRADSVLAYVRAHGSPPECAGFVATLVALQ